MLSPAPTQQSFGNLVGESVEMGISATGKLFDIFFDKVYTHKLLAVFREILSNAADAHIEAGHLELPVDERPAIKVCVPTSVDRPTFVCRDFGNGMSYETVMGLYATPFNSTKSANNSVTGMLGIGSKSPFAVADSFIVISIFEGLKSVYLVHRNDQGNPALTVLSKDAPTHEPNGVEVRVEVNSDFLADRESVRRDFKKALLGFAGKHAVEVYGDPELSDLGQTYPANENAFELLASIPQVFKYNLGDGYESHDVSLFHNGVAGLRGGVHIRQGTAVYPLDPDSLGSLEAAKIRLFSGLRDNVVVIIDVPLGTCDVSPDRESLSMDAVTTRNLSKLVALADAQVYSEVLTVAKQLYLQDTRGFGHLVAKRFAYNVYADPEDVLVTSGIPRGFTINGLNKLYSTTRRRRLFAAATQPMNKNDGIWFQGSRVSRHQSTAITRSVVADLKSVSNTPRNGRDSFIFTLQPAPTFNPETGRTHLLVLEPGVDMKYTGRRKATAVAEIMLRNGRTGITVDEIYEELYTSRYNQSSLLETLTKDQLLVVDVGRNDPLVKALVKRLNLGHDQLHFLSDFEPSLSVQRYINAEEEQLKGEVVAGAASGVYQTNRQRFVRNTYTLEELRDPAFWDTHDYIVVDKRPTVGNEFSPGLSVWFTDNKGNKVLGKLNNSNSGNKIIDQPAGGGMADFVQFTTGHPRNTVESGFAFADYLWDLAGRLGLNQKSANEYLTEFTSSSRYTLSNGVYRGSPRTDRGTTQFFANRATVPTGTIVFTETSFARVNPPQAANFVKSEYILVDTPGKYRRALRLADKAFDDLFKIRALMTATENLNTGQWQDSEESDEFVAALLLLLQQRELTKHLNRYFEEVVGVPVSQIVNEKTCEEVARENWSPFRTLARFLVFPSIFCVDSSDVGSRTFDTKHYRTFSSSEFCVTASDSYGPYAIPRVHPDIYNSRYRNSVRKRSLEGLLSGDNVSMTLHEFYGASDLRDAMRAASWVNRFVSRIPEISARRAPGWAVLTKNARFREDYLNFASESARVTWLEAIGIDTTVTTMDTTDVASMIRSATQRQESE